MNVFTAEEVAAKLKVDYKTVLRLIQRGHIKTLPGIRHKRITEAELDRYLGVKEVLTSMRITSRQSSETHSKHGQIVETSTAKAVAPPLAQSAKGKNKCN